MDTSRANAPTVETLQYVGFEAWQISLIKKAPHSAQWAAHDEMLRRSMTNGDTEDLGFL